MKKEIHKADSRGHADHGWLNSYHSFSFAGYYNPNRMNFGALRVLNDDTVAGGKGFGEHPHANMEIISIPLEGDLEHRDSMGNATVIRKGDVQVMSAGAGVAHSEFNHNRDRPVKFLQIWIFPESENNSPRYGQTTFHESDRKNRFQQIVYPGTTGEGTWIRQQAWMHLADLDAGTKLSYDLRKSDNGVYLFVLEGELTVAGEALGRRDAVGVHETEKLEIDANTGASVLVIEVPMG